MPQIQINCHDDVLFITTDFMLVFENIKNALYPNNG